MKTTRTNTTKIPAGQHDTVSQLWKMGHKIKTVHDRILPRAPLAVDLDLNDGPKRNEIRLDIDGGRFYVTRAANSSYQWTIFRATYEWCPVMECWEDTERPEVIDDYETDDETIRTVVLELIGRTVDAIVMGLP